MLGFTSSMRLFICLLYFLLFFLTTLVFPSQTRAQFVKYSLNPIIDIGPPGSWNERFSFCAAVIWINGNGKIWYSGYMNNKQLSIGYATFSDDLIFQHLPSNPIIPRDVLGASHEGNDCMEVLREEHDSTIVYKMWFTNKFGPLNNDFRIYYATSPDGIVWTNMTAINLNFPNGTAPNTPSVLFNTDLNKYQMWFGAKNFSTDHWAIGYAESVNGIDWNNVIFPVIQASQGWDGLDNSNPSAYIENNVYYLFYSGHPNLFYATSSNGISWNKNTTTAALTIDSAPNSTQFDRRNIFYTDFVKYENKYYLFYTGSDGFYYRIGLAISDTLPPVVVPTGSLSPTPTPTPTATPTSTPTATPTMTPTETPIPTVTPTTTPTPTITLTPTPTGPPPFSPIIIIPGLGASWNPTALLSCNPSMSTNWTLAPYVHIYDRLIKTLTQNAHLEMNKDVYLYPYDWRQPLPVQAHMFQTYINNILATKPPGTKFRIVAHSMGGLVMRSYLANNPTHSIAFVLTVGTPHAGTLLAYPLWEAGETLPSQKLADRIIQIAITHLINWCKLLPSPPKHPSRREALRHNSPSIRDLLPVFDYLKKHGNTISYASLTVQNSWVQNHPFPDNLYNTVFETLSGNLDPTARFFHVVDPSQKDIQQGDWLDGKVTNTEKILSGDGTVLQLSSKLAGTTNTVIEADHLEIIAKREGIRKILDFLGLTTISPAAEVAVPEITSNQIITVSLDIPAQFEFTDPKTRKKRTTDGIFVLFNPEVGVHRLRIVPQQSGTTHLSLSQFDNVGETGSDAYKLSLVKNKPAEYLIIYNPSRLLSPKLIPL